MTIKDAEELVEKLPVDRFPWPNFALEEVRRLRHSMSGSEYTIYSQMCTATSGFEVIGWTFFKDVNSDYIQRDPNFPEYAVLLKDPNTGITGWIHSTADRFVQLTTANLGA